MQYYLGALWRLFSRVNLLKVTSLAMFSSERYCRVPIESTNGLVRLLCFEPGQSVALHCHPKSDELFLVVEGNGRITIEREEQDAEAGCMIRVPAGTAHQWIGGTHRLVLLSVLIPSSSYASAREATEQKFV